MIDRYTKFYEQRSASRERTGKAAAANTGKENAASSQQIADKVKNHERLIQQIKGKQKQELDESLGLRDPLQLLEQDMEAAQQSTNPKKPLVTATAL